MVGGRTRRTAKTGSKVRKSLRIPFYSYFSSSTSTAYLAPVELFACSYSTRPTTVNVVVRWADDDYDDDDDDSLGEQRGR